MHSMRVQAAIRFFLLIATLEFTNGGNADKWWIDIDVTKPFENLKGLIPAGYEEDTMVDGASEKLYINLYVCRGWDKKRWVPGKLFVRSYQDGNMYCSFPGKSTTYYKIIEQNLKNIQILSIPGSLASWIPAKYNITDHYVDAAKKTMICRVRNNDLLHVGQFNQDESKCVFSYYGVNSSANHVEILAFNMLGLVKLAM